MKVAKFICVFGLTILVNQLFSQVYMYLDSGTAWSVEDYKFYTSGEDSVIDGLNYKVVSFVKDSMIDIDSVSTFAFVREDSSTRQVYCLHPDSNNPKLIYDFDLSINDTVTVYNRDPNFTICEGQPAILSVTSIDSIYFNGGFHKRFYFDGMLGFRSEYWIEGIGSTFGLFGSGISHCNVADIEPPALLCFQHSDSIFINNWMNTNTDSICYREYNPWVSIKEIKTGSVNIYPNPTSGILNIDIDIPVEVNIFSIDGRLLFNDPSCFKVVDISQLRSGCYFVSISYKDFKSYESIVVR